MILTLPLDNPDGSHKSACDRVHVACAVRTMRPGLCSIYPGYITLTAKEETMPLLPRGSAYTV